MALGRLLAATITAAGLMASIPTAAALSLEDFRDPQDGRIDASRYLLDLKGFLPVPILITEPALGYGLGAALLFFDRNTDPGAAPRTTGRPTPPDISALGGFRTENGSDGIFAGHLGYSRDGNWRYLAGAANASLNLAFYGDATTGGGPARGLDYNLDGNFLVADLRRRIPDTEWFVGARFLRVDTTNRFSAGRPSGIDPRELDSTIAGLALVAEYDGRDTIFTPSSGTRLTLNAYDFGDTWGGDRAFRLGRVAVNSFWPIAPRLVLGARADWRGVSGDAPFYALPFVELRGIPAMRYQGERVAVLEAEARWDLDGRWSLVGFGGAGRTAGGVGESSASSTHGAGGVGLRYFLARALGLHVGVDIARGPEETAFYVIVGSAWR